MDSCSTESTEFSFERRLFHNLNTGVHIDLVSCGEERFVAKYFVVEENNECNSAGKIIIGREIEIFCHLRGYNLAHVVKFISAGCGRLHSEKAPTKNIYYLAIEYQSKGTLFELIRKPYGTKHPLEKLLRTVFYKLLEAVKEIHAKKVAHLDLKPENITFNEHATIKLIDFGSSAILESKESRVRPSHVMGSKYYQAPEIEEGRSQEVNMKADVFSLGVILFAMYFKCLPFSSCLDSNYEMIKSKRFKNFWNKIIEERKMTPSIELKHIITTMLQYDSNKRPTVDDLCNHKWIKGQEFVSNSDILELLN